MSKNDYVYYRHVILILQIKIWKKGQKNTTLEKEFIPDSAEERGFGIERTRRQAIAYKTGRVGNLPANCGQASRMSANRSRFCLSSAEEAEDDDAEVALSGLNSSPLSPNNSPSSPSVPLETTPPR